MMPSVKSLEIRPRLGAFINQTVIRDGLLGEPGAVDPAVMSRWQGCNSCFAKKILLILHNYDAFFAPPY